MSSYKDDPKFLRAYDRGMLRSAFVSLFWGIISERKKRGGFTLQALARLLGTNKGEVSRWFSGDPNWTINTISNLAHALDVDLKIEAIDRTSGVVFTPSGIQVAARTSATIAKPVETHAGTESPIRLRHSTGASAENVWLVSEAA